MELYFLRHAIAAEPGSAKFRNDSERPLTPEGVEKFEKAAKGIRKAGLTFHRIVSSPYVRARQTAEIVAKEIGFEGKVAFSDAMTPEADFRALAKLVAEFGDAEDVLLVGHQPSIGRFVSQLIAARPDASIDFKKGALCRVELLQKDPAVGVLKGFFSPKFLQKLA
jgi:phosphohistidine phosphatase